MFILLSGPASFSSAVATLPEPPTWLHVLRLPLALLASLILLLIARHLISRPTLPIALSVQPKLIDVKTCQPLPATEVPASSGSASRFRWLPWLSRSKEMTTIKAATPRPVTATLPLPTPQGRAPSRAGPVRRPEPALAPHTQVDVEAPLPALFDCQTPVSMAKIIMSRHTYRRPSPHPSRAPSISTSPAPSS
ncbi:hypothetical protein FB45DRAFT_934361 [Roridomyces roridus]|uniref:Uncharacterized protein n=1 Tax=Roridomyces roridus TaxID=1738132 RepID=A0AAD7BC81_9AGAR|nr:hypothetical protein FB45DRAFT_934361 [Roridomyces roridus]